MTEEAKQPESDAVSSSEADAVVDEQAVDEQAVVDSKDAGSSVTAGHEVKTEVETQVESAEGEVSESESSKEPIEMFPAEICEDDIFIDDDDDSDDDVSSEGAIEEEVEDKPAEDIAMDWYILKVQSNRERSISEALLRKIKVNGQEDYFDQVIVPTEKVTEFKNGKKRVVNRKLFPGYIVVHMHINDDTWFTVRETSGIGDFTGAAGKPSPMLPHEVARIVKTVEEETEEQPKLDIKFKLGDRVKIKEGNFESFEGDVSEIDEASGRITVMINIFGRSTPVQLEHWHLEAV